MTEKEKFYGKLIVDFANAKTTDEAYLQYIDNLAAAFGFSLQFVEKAKQNAPSFEDTLERAFVDSIIEEMEQYQRLGRYFHSSFVVLEDVDIELENLLFSVDHGDGPEDYLKIPIRDINNQRDVKIGILDEEKQNFVDFDEQRFTGDIEKLIQAVIHRRELSEKISEERRLKIENPYDKPLDKATMSAFLKMRYAETETYIDTLREKIRYLLEDFRLGQLAFENDTFQELLDTYNRIEKAPLIMTSTGFLQEGPVFDEESLSYYFSKLPVLRNYIDEPLSYCFIKFMVNDNNRRYLKKCDKCENYFIAKRGGNKQRFCSDRCRLALHNKNRIESGRAAEYKRNKRREGAKDSYY